MQSLQLHASQRRHPTTKTSHTIKFTELEKYVRLEQTYSETAKRLPTGQMPEMRQRTTHLQQRSKQNNLQCLWRIVS